MAEFWDRKATLGEIERSDRTKIVIAEVEKDGKAFTDIRGYYQHRRNDEWLPGKGIAVPQELVSRLIEILTEHEHE